MNLNRRSMSDINVTPFVDVVLVLLIIFMLTAPFIQGAVDVNLPRAEARQVDLKEGILHVVLPKSGSEPSRRNR